MAKHHDLKIHPEWFSLTLGGKLPFQVRLNDRCFQPGDTVTLNEFYPPNDDRYLIEGPTDSNIKGAIKDVFVGLPGIKEGYVVFTLEPLGT